MPTNFETPLKPEYIPFIFLFLDTINSFEFGLLLLYKKEHIIFNGKDLFHYHN